MTLRRPDIKRRPRLQQALETRQHHRPAVRHAANELRILDRFFHFMKHAQLDHVTGRFECERAA